jgi:nitrite reductase (NAD(P)H)
LTSNGRTISYDVLVLATGSEPTIPPYVSEAQTTGVTGIFVYRNISDLNLLMAYAEKIHNNDGNVVVIGGGLLGLEAAKAVFDL